MTRVLEAAGECLARVCARAVALHNTVNPNQPQTRRQTLVDELRLGPHSAKLTLTKTRAHIKDCSFEEEMNKKVSS